MPLYHCTIFTINIWMGGEIGTAIIIIMIYYKKKRRIISRKLK